MPLISVGQAIVEVRGIDLLSKNIATAAGRYVAETQRMSAASARLGANTQAVSARVTALNDKIAASTVAASTKVKTAMATAGKAVQTYQVKIGSARAIQARDMNAMALLANKVSAAELDSLNKAAILAQRIADREAKIAKTASGRQRGGLVTAQVRDTAALRAEMAAVTSLTAAEANKYQALVRNIALKKNEIAIAQQQITKANQAAKIEIDGIRRTSTALQQKLTLRRDDLLAQQAALQQTKANLDAEIAMRLRAEAVAKRQMQLSRVSSGLSSAGLMGTVAVTMPIVAAGTSIAKVAKEFDASMRNIQAIGKQTDNIISDLGDTFIEMSTDIKRTVATPNELAQAFYEVQSASFYGADAQRILEASTKAATAGLADQVVTAKAVAQVINAYNTSTAEAGHYTDVMVRAVDIGVFRFEDLVQQMGDFVGAAGMMKVPIEEVMAAMSTMTKRGIQASEAATSLNRILMTYLKPSKQQVALAQELGIELSATTLKTKGLAGALAEVVAVTGGNEDVLADLFSEMRAVRGAFALVSDGAQMFNRDLKELYKSAGAVDQIFSTQTRSWEMQFKNLQNTISALAIDFGEELVPGILEITNTNIRPLVESFNNLSDAQQNTVLETGLLVALLPPLAIGLGGILGVVNNLISAFTGLANSAGFLGFLIKGGKGLLSGGLFAGITEAFFGTERALQRANEWGQLPDEIKGNYEAQIAWLTRKRTELQDLLTLPDLDPAKSEAYAESINTITRAIKKMAAQPDTFTWEIFNRTEGPQQMAAEIEHFKRIQEMAGKRVTQTADEITKDEKVKIRLELDTTLVYKDIESLASNLAKLQLPSIPGEQKDLFEFDATQIRNYIGEILALPGAFEANKQAVMDLAAAAVYLETEQGKVITEFVRLNTEAGSITALDYLATQLLGTGSSAQDLINDLDDISPTMRDVIISTIDLSNAVRDLQNIAKKPISIDVSLGLLADSLSGIKGQALELAEFWGTEKITDWYNAQSEAATRLEKDMRGAGATELEIEIALERLKLKNDNWISTLKDSGKSAAKASKDAANEWRTNWEKAIGEIQSKLDEGMNFSTGLGDLSGGTFGGGPLAPGANGPFEALYRLQDIAMNLGKPTEGPDTKKWYEMYFGGQGFADAAAQATEIVKKFQMGIFTPDVTQFIDEQKIVDSINMEKIAAASKQAYADALLKAHPELDQKNLNSLLGIKEDAEGNFSVPDMSKVVTAVQAQFTAAAVGSKLDIMTPMLGLNNLDAILTSDKFKGVIPLVSKGMETAIIADTTLATQGERAFDKFEGGFVNRARNSSALKRTVELMILDALNEDED